MPDPSAELRSSIGLTLESLAQMGAFVAQFAARLHKLIMDAGPALLAFAAALQSIKQAPPVPGYEESLINNGYDPLAARILAAMLLRLGEQRLKEIRAERKLASAISGVVKVGDATPLVISRRARSVVTALDDMAMAALCAACSKARVPETACSIGTLAEQAMRRDAAACRRLSEVCTALKPHLADPRGPTPSLASVAHELQLHLLKRGYLRPNQRRI